MSHSNETCYNSTPALRQRNSLFYCSENIVSVNKHAFQTSNKYKSISVSKPDIISLILNWMWDGETLFQSYIFTLFLHRHLFPTCLRRKHIQYSWWSEFKVSTDKCLCGNSLVRLPKVVKVVIVNGFFNPTTQSTFTLLVLFTCTPHIHMLITQGPLQERTISNNPI